MNTSKEIISIINKAKKNGLQLSNPETLEILKAYRSIAIDKKLVDSILKLILTLSKRDRGITVLSTRENQIFNLVGLGFKSKEIGNLLNISLDTVSTHRKNIIKKLQITGTGQLQQVALLNFSNRS